MKKKQIWTQAVRDICKALAVGIAAGAVFSLLLLAGGYLFGGFQWENALEVMKNGLMFVAAMGMFLIAGMLLTKGKKETKEKKEENGWRRHFRVIGFKSVLSAICIALLLWASLADYLLLMR